MSYDEALAARLRLYFSSRDEVSEKTMMGGLAFMINGNMCVGASDHRLMARIGPRHYATALKDMHVSIMNYTGKPLKGFVYVEPEALISDEQLHGWIKRCEHFVQQLPPKNVQLAG